jgi:hypothetical protein
MPEVARATTGAPSQDEPKPIRTVAVRSPRELAVEERDAVSIAESGRV